MSDVSTSARVVLLASLVLGSVPGNGSAQQTREPKHVLVLQWYDRAYESNLRFDSSLQAALRSYVPEQFEYHSEYLETNKFPGEDQSSLLSDYLRHKYARHRIDIVVARTNIALDFLLRYRNDLFPDTPIVFATPVPTSAEAMSAVGATGIVYGNTYTKTVDLALGLHPGTSRLFVVSGTRNHDKSLENIARQQLRGRSGRVGIEYLTDLAPEELKQRVATLPPHSIVLYVWQQIPLRHDKVMESQEVLSLVIGAANAPVYGMSFANVGLGIVGGYIWTFEGNAAKLADLIVRVTRGERAAQIPVSRAPDVPMFDWRQVQRWGIGERRLPRGSVVRFRDPSMWEQYKWRIVGALALFAVQAFLIAGLLVLWRRARRSESRLRIQEARLEAVVEQRTVELVEARDQAVAANRAKSAFLANMNHELRTPLNAILGFSAMVRAEAALSEQHRKDLDIVGHSGEHLLGLIDGVLDMAKIETGGVAVESTSFDLRTHLNETLNMLQERALAKNLSLVLELSPDAPRFVRTDPGKVRQVLTNLIGNAIKYTDEGSVVLRVDARSGGRGLDVALRFEVEDTGIGIAEEDQARIFEPFVQLGGAKTRKGTGLGLSITHHFVQLLNGTIQLDSEVGRGSRFRVEIPVQTAESSEISLEPADRRRVIALQRGQPDYRILIVEDQRENWRLLKRLLQAVGFDVKVSEDGARAVDSFAAWRPDFIWMDVRLPVLSGREAAKRIRAMDGGRHVKIVAVTASAFDTERDEVLAAGFDDFMRKPYQEREIFDCMARHLGVSYVYATDDHKAETPAQATLRSEDLAALPETLREDLEHAILSLDQDRIADLVGKASEQDRSVGSALQSLAENLRYSAILIALEGCKERSVKAGGTDTPGR